jgi:hypothetical protein
MPTSPARSTISGPRAPRTAACGTALDADLRVTQPRTTTPSATRGGHWHATRDEVQLAEKRSNRHWSTAVQTVTATNREELQTTPFAHRGGQSSGLCCMPKKATRVSVKTPFSGANEVTTDHGGTAAACSALWAVHRRKPLAYTRKRLSPGSATARSALWTTAATSAGVLPPPLHDSARSSRRNASSTAGPWPRLPSEEAGDRARKRP